MDLFVSEAEFKREREGDRDRGRQRERERNLLPAVLPRCSQPIKAGPGQF